MNDPIPYNNEFDAAKQALVEIGSSLWFSGLSHGWQDFLVSHTVEYFDNRHVTMQRAASVVFGIYQDRVSVDPSILQKNPWHSNLNFNTSAPW